MKKLLGLIAITALFSANVFAAEDRPAGKILTSPRPVMESSEWRPHVGLVGGVASTEANGDTYGEYGIDVGYQYYIPYSLGAEYTHSRASTSTGDQNRDTVWIKGTYNFAGDNAFIRNSYAAIAVGAVFTTAETSAAIAPILGFDIPLKEAGSRSFFSVGANTRYAFIGNNNDDSYSLSGVVKYWY